MPQSSTPVVAGNTVEDDETYIPTESGQIKAIMITDPKTGDLLNDSSKNIKGEVTNVIEEYSVEIYDNGESVGSTETVSTNEWEFSKDSDWSEGDHDIEAKISGKEIMSESVDFKIDSNPPEIDEESISVSHDNGSFTVSFSVDEEVGDAILVTGEKSFKLSQDEEGDMVADISKDDIGDSVQLVVADVLGNSTSIDVSEYFIDEEEEENVRPSFTGIIKSANITDQINIVVAFVIFVLLCIEVYVYWKKNKFKNMGNDLFVLGFWWLLLIVGLTTGFSGFIN